MKYYRLPLLMLRFDNTPTGGSVTLTRHRAVLCTGLVVLVGLAYATTLQNPFIYDDNRMVVENLAIRDLSNLRAVLILEATRPILNLSYAIDYAIFGPYAAGFHTINVLLHAVNVVLLFLLAWRLAEDEAPAGGSAVRPQIVALTAAVLFAVHPMMTEAVSYVSGRSEVLCTTFFLLGFLSVRRWMLGGTRVWWLAASSAGSPHSAPRKSPRCCRSSSWRTSG